MIQSFYRSSAGIDVHNKVIVCTVIRQDEHGNKSKQTREFKTFHSELKVLAKWLKEQDVEVSAMESTGVLWKPLFEVLERFDVPAILCNARHVKNVPGRKTDILDSEWLADLALCGLLRASFIPPRDFRELRLLTRYRMRITGMLASEKNRLYKILDSCGIKLGAVVSDIDGVSARRMIEALVRNDMQPKDVAKMGLGSLRHKKRELRLSLEGTLSDRHRFLLTQIHTHMDNLEKSIAEIDSQVVMAMKPYEKEWQLIQTIPGFDEISAAMLLAEIGVDMSRFGNKDRLSSWAGMSPGNHESAGKKSPEKPPRETST